MTTTPPPAPIAIIAALQREIAPLVRGWQPRRIEFLGHRYRCYQRGDVVAVAGGIGPRPASWAAQAVIHHCAPALLVSAGVAGALVSPLAPGDLVTCGEVLDSASHRRYRTLAGEGLLVTTTAIAGPEEKRLLAAHPGAIAVDMEAAAVAEAAQSADIRFLAVKAIADPLAFPLPPLGPFLRPDGSFATVSFLCQVAWRPWHWRSLAVLAGNTRTAIAALNSALRDLIDNQGSLARAIKSKGEGLD